jgi:O-antigen/teichoic acid export membrane protein
MTNNHRDFLVVIFGKIAQVILMFATLKVSTHLLPPGIMGQIYIFTTIYTFFVFFLISPIGQYFNRYTHQWESEGVLFSRLKLYFCYMTVVCVTAMIGAGAVHLLGGANDFSLFPFLILTGLFVLVVSANQTVIPLLNMLNYRILFTILTFFTGFSALVFSVFFVVFVDVIATAWLMGLLLGNALTLIVAVFYLRKILITNEDISIFVINLTCLNKKNAYKIAMFAVPVSLATVFMWAQNAGYRVSIESYLGLDYLGLLGVGFMVATQLSSVVESILMQYLQPNFYRRIKGADLKERTQAVNAYLSITIPVYLALALFLTFSIEYIFPILVSGEYKEGYLFCIFGVWIEFFRMVTNAVGTIAHSEIKMKGYMYPYILGALTTNVLVYLAATSSFELDLIPIALLVGASITCLIMYINMKKIMCFSISLLSLLLSALSVVPCVIYFHYISFTPEIGLSYLVLLCVGGFIFLGSLTALFFTDRKING